MIVDHGGTDAGPPPQVDFSTNANPLGPSPAALDALRADVHPYPDPTATATRVALAAHHGVAAERIVVGAGATELIDRLVRVHDGPVLSEDVTFGEYAGAAARHGRPHRTAPPDDRFLEALPGATLAFVATPGSPDGRLRDPSWCEHVAASARRTGTTVVWDLAYAPLCAAPAPPTEDSTVVVHAPNKAHGCTGLRAGWLAAPPALAARLRAAAVTWLVSTPGLRFLSATATPQADAWVAGCLPTLQGWTEALATGVAGLGLDVHRGDVPFVLIDVPDATALSARLRERHGIKVRDTTSMGRPGSWRVAARPEADTQLLRDALDRELPCVP